MKKILLFAILAFSINAKAQWVQTNGPFGGQYVWCTATSGATIYAGGMNGVFISNNNGNLWTPVNNGLTDTYIKTILIRDTNVFVGTYGGVFLSTNKGTSWKAVNNGLPSKGIVWSLVTKGTTIFAGIYSDGSNPDGVYVSSNNGTTWTAVNNGLPTGMNGYIEIMGLGVNGTTIYAQPRNSGIYSSNNDGASWTLASNGYSSDPNSFHFAASGNDIYVGNSFGIFHSNNSGGTWTHYTSPFFSNGILSLAIIGNDLLAGTNNGVCLSHDKGATWTNISTNGIANQAVTTFAISGTNIFAGTTTSGVWTRHISEFTGLLEQDSENGFKVYPNPNSGNFKIESNENDYVLSITNFLGEQIYIPSKKSRTQDIDLSRQSNGIYYLNIKTEKETSLKKIIINK
jgi:hypothetical protein